jgi:glycosyltransferase involved in cell wall biosynthesis
MLPTETDAPSAIELSVLIPVHNEEDNVGLMIERVAAALEGFGKAWELIIIDDGSTDSTLATARRALADTTIDLRIIEFQRNFGQAAGLQAGFDAARGRLIATLDGDLQNDPADIPMMVTALESRELDLLAGWRKSRQDGLLLRKIPSWCANYLIGKITGVKIHDYGCGLKLYRAGIVKQVRIMGGMHRFIPAWVASVVPSSRIGEIVVNHHARQFGTSKYGISRTFRVILDLLAVLFFMRFRARPGHFFGMIGLGAGAISMLIFVYLAIEKLVFGENIGTRPLLMVGVVLFLSSMQFITTGILAELIVRSSGSAGTAAGYVVRRIFERPAA